MDQATRGQVVKSAAEIYETFFVPALFAQWSAPVCDKARISTGDNVLDVACGTGVLAREAATRVGQPGSVTGLDCNPDMLAVARRMAPQITWAEGSAEDLPFQDKSFDAVVSQFGLMFFEDRGAALENMWRVLKPGGRLCVAVWDRIENATGHAAMERLLDRLFGGEFAAAMHAPFCLGDAAELAALFLKAGVPDAAIETIPGEVTYRSIEDWVHTEIRGWTLADRISDQQFEALASEASSALACYCDADGTVRFPSPAHLVGAIRT